MKKHLGLTLIIGWPVHISTRQGRNFKFNLLKDYFIFINFITKKRKSKKPLSIIYPLVNVEGATKGK